MSEAQRVLLVLNEPSPCAHADWYRGLERLQDEGLVGAWRVYPFLARRLDGLDDSAMLREVAAAAGSIAATTILWAHFVGVPVSSAQFEAIGGPENPVVHGFWEGDGYDPFRKPLPRATLSLCARCDAVFVPVDGYPVGLLKRHGCRDIRYAPTTGDDRYEWQPPRSDYDFDVVMIGSKIVSRVPLRTMPGNAVRRRLVAAFSKRYGRRFGVFGPGWSGPNAMGPLDSSLQAETYGRSLSILGNDNLPARYEFSNRLPIAMGTGRPVIYNSVDGYREVFGDESGVYWFGSVKEALSSADAVIEDPIAAFAEAQKASAIAKSRFSMYHILQYMLRVLASKRLERDGIAEAIANPWIRRERL